MIANSFQGKMTGTTLLSQREESETQLRASMLNSLSEPVIGGEKGAKVHPDRERLLVELLALNFHEHFELKPLMSQLDAEFSADPPQGMTKEQALRARESLRSVARRVVSQQIASLIKESGPSTAQSGCNVYLLTVKTDITDGDTPGTYEAYSKFEEPIRVESPDKKYTVHVVASNPDRKNETFKFGVNLITNGSHEQQSYGDVAYNFELGWFDFPMTDNTLLPDGNRFAFNLVAVSGKAATLRLIWFPKNYFTPRERPLDYRDTYDRLESRNKEANSARLDKESVTTNYSAAVTRTLVLLCACAMTLPARCNRYSESEIPGGPTLSTSASYTGSSITTTMMIGCSGPARTRTTSGRSYTISAQLLISSIVSGSTA